MQIETWRDWIPDRKVLAGGIVFVLAFLTAGVLTMVGVDIPYEATLGMLTAVLPLAAAYLWPEGLPGALATLDRILRRAGEEGFDSILEEDDPDAAMEAIVAADKKEDPLSTIEDAIRGDRNA